MTRNKQNHPWSVALRGAMKLKEAREKGRRLRAKTKVQEMKIKERLEYLRGQIRAECISLGELCELQDLAKHIGKGDVELLEAAGVPENCECDHWSSPNGCHPDCPACTHYHETLKQ